MDMDFIKYMENVTTLVHDHIYVLSTITNHKILSHQLIINYQKQSISLHQCIN